MSEFEKGEAYETTGASTFFPNIVCCDTATSDTEMKESSAGGWASYERNARAHLEHRFCLRHCEMKSSPWDVDYVTGVATAHTWKSPLLGVV